MNKFINYTEASGITVNSYRKPECFCCGDMVEFIDSVFKEEPAYLTLDDVQQWIDFLEDGEALTRLGIGDDDQYIVEIVHSALKGCQNENGCS